LTTTIAKQKIDEAATTTEPIAPQSLMVWFAALFILNLLLRVFYLRYQFVNGDEAVRALTAVNLLDGGRLYADIVTDKPPGTTFFYAGVFAVFGKNMAALHLVAALWHFLTSMVLYFTAARIYSKRAGLWAALFSIYFSASYLTQDMMAANTELLMALPLAASFSLYVYSLQKQGKATAISALLLFAVGALTGIAALFKQLGIFNVALFVFSEAFFVYRLRQSESFFPALKQSLIRLLLIACGLLAVCLALVLWLTSLHTLTDFWRYVFVMNKFYVGALSPSLWLTYLVSRSFAYVAFNLPLWLLAGWAVKRAVADFRSPTANQQIFLQAPLLAWAGVSLVAVFAGGRFLGHYFLQLVPALAILAAQGAQLLVINFRNETTRRKATILLVVLSVCLLVNLVRFHRRTAILAYETVSGQPTTASQQWGMSQREAEAAIIASKVRERLQAGESLYIWGYGLDVYWRSDCRPATRFITPNHITGAFEGAGGDIAEASHPFWAESRRLFLEDLQNNRPPLILDVTGELASLPYTEIKEFLETHYRRNGEIGIDAARPFIVYERLK